MPKPHKVVLKDIVTVDFETYYDTDFSLTNQAINTSGYIRDERFKVHCIGIKDGLKKAQWYEPKDGWKKLKSFDWKKRDLLAHNTQFDGGIMAYLKGIIPRFYYDTLAMTRGLHSEVSRAALGKIAAFYRLAVIDKGRLVKTKGLRELNEELLWGLGDTCRIDVETCFDVFRFQIDVFPKDELRLIDLVTRMFTDPVLEVDITRAKIALGDELLEVDALIASSGVTREELASAAGFAKCLEALGIEPPTKVSNKTGNVNFAFAKTDPEFNDLLEHDDPRVVRLIEARLAAKSTLDESRAMRLIRAGENGQKLPIAYNYAAAKTLRFGGANKMNMQNFRRGSELRKSIIAPRGHEIVTSDSAQIEARLNDYMAGQMDALEEWRAYDAGTGPDPYKLLACDIYAKDVEDITSDERFIGKTGKLGLGFQMGAQKLQTTLALGTLGPPVEMSLEMCQAIVNIYRKKADKVKDQWAAAKNMLIAMIQGKSGTYRGGILEYEPNTIWLPSGMGLHYPALTAVFDEDDRITGFKYRSHDFWLRIFGGKLVENFIQALARIVVMNHHMLEIADKYRVVMTTHDEISCCVPKRQVDACMEYMLKVMRTAPAWCPDLPLNAEAKSAPYYCK